MHCWLVAEVYPLSSATVLLLLGMGVLYAASRLAVDALSRRSPERISLGHWMPIAAVAGSAAARGLPQVAIGVVFGSTVAALSLAMGLVLYMAPPTDFPPSRRAWQFFLPGVLVPVLGGFAGSLNAVDALILLALGGVVRFVWWDPQNVSTSLPGPQPETSSKPILKAAQWLLCIGLALLGARLVLLGSVSTEAESRALSAGLIASVIVSPILLLPMITSGTDLAQRRRSGDAASAMVGLAMLNLFLLLPLVIFFWYFRAAVTGPMGWNAVWSRMDAIPISIRVWRIDGMALAILGLALIPVGLGRWVIGKLEATILVVGYAGYLAASAASVSSGMPR